MVDGGYLSIMIPEVHNTVSMAILNAEYIGLWWSWTWSQRWCSYIGGVHRNFILLPLTELTIQEIHQRGCNAGACHAQMYTMSRQPWR